MFTLLYPVNWKCVQLFLQKAKQSNTNKRAEGEVLSKVDGALPQNNKFSLSFDKNEQIQIHSNQLIWDIYKIMAHFSHSEYTPAENLWTTTHIKSKTFQIRVDPDLVWIVVPKYFILLLCALISLKFFFGFHYHFSLGSITVLQHRQKHFSNTFPFPVGELFRSVCILS